MSFMGWSVMVVVSFSESVHPFEQCNYTRIAAIHPLKIIYINIARIYRVVRAPVIGHRTPIRSECMYSNSIVP
jgi:hypothetical protein